MRILLSFLFCSLVMASSAPAGGPADDLLKLTPPHSSATLVVEGLRDRAREIFASPLFEAIWGSAAGQRWMGSPGARRAAGSLRRIEAAFGLPIATIRDQILGDAAVLAFFPGPAESPKDSRGLFLIRRHDRDVVERLFEAANRAQTRSGEVVKIDRRLRGAIPYAVRVYRPGTKPDECYAHLDGSTFAWSNSETLIQAVLDLKLAGGPSLADDPGFGKVRLGLPEDSLASLFVSSGLLRRMRAASPPPSNIRERIFGLIFDQHAEAVAFSGLGLAWKEGLALHQHEALVPEKLDPTVRRWLAGPPAPPAFAPSVPDTALAMAAVDVDLHAVGQVLIPPLVKTDEPLVSNLRVAIRGYLLGVDPIIDLIPRIKNGLLAYLDENQEPGRPLFSPVGAVGWSEVPGLPVLMPAIESALRTYLATRAIALASRPELANLGLLTRAIDGDLMTVFGNGQGSLAAFRIDGGRLVFGNAPGPVRRFARGGAREPTTIDAIRTRLLPDSSSFAIADLDRLARSVTRDRAAIAGWLAKQRARPIADADRDLDQALGLAALFRALVVESKAIAGGAEIHRRVMLIPR